MAPKRTRRTDCSFPDPLPGPERLSRQRMCDASPDAEGHPRPVQCRYVRRSCCCRSCASRVRRGATRARRCWASSRSARNDSRRRRRSGSERFGCSGPGRGCSDRGSVSRWTGRAGRPMGRCVSSSSSGIVSHHLPSAAAPGGPAGFHRFRCYRDMPRAYRVTVRVCPVRLCKTLCGLRHELRGIPGSDTVPPMPTVAVHVVDHPLVAHKLTVLRDARTDTPTFRSLADELVTLLAYEATRNAQVEPVTVQTPVAEAHGVTFSGPRHLVVPVLRAGLGMLD